MSKRSPLRGQVVTSSDKDPPTVLFSSGGPVGDQLWSSGKASGEEVWGAFAIGAAVTPSKPIPFQLAPRLYVLSCIEFQHGAGNNPFVADLPLHLTFQVSPSNAVERTRQAWVSENCGQAAWELIVERDQASIEVTLTAASPGDANGSVMVWKNEGNWDPFGNNRLKSAGGTPGIPSLNIAAP